MVGKGVPPLFHVNSVPETLPSGVDDCQLFLGGSPGLKTGLCEPENRGGDGWRTRPVREALEGSVQAETGA